MHGSPGANAARTALRMHRFSPALRGRCRGPNPPG